MRTVVVTFLTALLWICGFVALSRAADPTAGQLTGKYYAGDHTGYNVSFDLQASGAYSASWEGCLGHYGDAKGHWALKGEQLILTPDEETGMMRDHLRQLRIFVQEDGLALVRQEDMQSDFYRKHGLSPFIAFRKQPETH